MAISSKGKGKSSGARVITFLVTDDQEVYLVHIYDKSQLENLNKDQILELLKNAFITYFIAHHDFFFPSLTFPMHG